MTDEAGTPAPGGRGESRPPPVELIDLPTEQRERAVPVLKDGFVGIYRWHAKRTLRGATWVRAALLQGEIVAVSVLERLDPEVGYVYYLSTALSHRREGLGTLLLDDALALFRRERAVVAYGAAEEENEASIALFRSRGFRPVERKELSFREGGLGAWGLRSRMTLVGGEVLMGLRLSSAGPQEATEGTVPERRR
ncbi:MAG: GNAT family N-acetyltransferase [Thermoplasmata archaeon]